MHIRTALYCLTLVMIMALLIPSGVVLATDADGTKITEGPDMFANAGIKPGDTCTIYYTDDGAIDKIVKGVPYGVKVNLQIIPVDRVSTGNNQTRSQVPIDNYLTYPSNPHETGPSRYCYRIYYQVLISAGCQTFFGMYNTSGNYATGQYVGPYGARFQVTGYITAWNDYWKHRISYYGGSTNHVTGYSDY